MDHDDPHAEYPESPPDDRDPEEVEDETLAAGMLVLPEQEPAASRLEEVDEAAPPDLAELQRADPGLAWAYRQEWISAGHLEALRRQWGSFAGITNAKRVLFDFDLIDADQRREMGEVAVLARQLPRMQLRKRLGSGAVGGVYLARDLDHDETVAVKIIHSELADQQETRARFEREIITLKGLNHESIPKLYRYDIAAEIPYLVMEFVPGVTLEELLKEAGRLPETYALWATIQIARALAHAYRRGGGLVHRDVKPDNVIVQIPKGADPDQLLTARHPLKIVDFGLARGQGDCGSLTMTGMVVGTPRYMAPEQVRGDDLDWRADLYAVGATLYHLVTGLVPFGGTSTADVMMAHISAPVPDPSDVIPSLSRRTCGIIMRAMAKDPADRFPNYQAFIQAVDQAMAALDSRPMVLLRKPFVMPKREGAAGGQRGGTAAASRSSRVRARISETHRHDRKKPAEVEAGASSVGLEDVFEQVDREERAGGGKATEALRRVLQARARGEASELDVDDLTEQSTRLRRRTSEMLDNAPKTSIGVLPILAAVIAAVVFAAVVLYRLL